MAPPRCFDYDRLESWEPAYAPFFAGLAPEAEWSRLLDPEEYSSADLNIEKLARRLRPDSAAALLALHDELDRYFRTQYTHAALYHACRIVDTDSYARDGLRATDIAEQNRLAAAIWGQSPALAKAIGVVRAQRYSDHNAGNVGLWYSRAGALHFGDGYTAGGSEYLRVLSNELGGGARAQLHARGRPALVRCIVPLGDLDPAVVRSLAVLPLRWRLTCRDPLAPPGFYALDWAFLHPAAIPAGQIEIEFLDAS